MGVPIFANFREWLAVYHDVVICLVYEEDFVSGVVFDLVDFYV